jgi:hypothetical protein
MPKKRPVVVEALVEGFGGELVFKPVELESQKDIKKLLETKNSVIKENLKKELKLRN